MRSSLSVVGLALGLLSSSGCEDNRMDRDGPATWRVPVWSGAAVSASAAAAAPPSSDDWIREDAAVLFAACPWTKERGFARDCAALESFTAALERRRPSPLTFLARLRSKDPKERALAGLLWDALEPDARVGVHLELLESILSESSPMLAKRRALDAARLPPSSKVPGLRAKVESFVQRAKPSLRGLFLSFVTIDPEDMAWIEPLLRAATADKDPAVRLAGLRGLSAMPDTAGHAKACTLWLSSLSDTDDVARHYAQNALVGNIDFMIEDENGLLAGRANPQRKPCDGDQVGAAVASAYAEFEAGRLSDLDQAVFFAGALKSKKPEAEKPSIKVLRGVAEDATKDRTARVLATRALRRNAASAKIVEPLTKDKDPQVAAAARGD